MNDIKRIAKICNVSSFEVLAAMEKLARPKGTRPSRKYGITLRASEVKNEKD